MTIADRMFNKLGYTKRVNGDTITYKKKYEIYDAFIIFQGEFETIECEIVFNNADDVLVLSSRKKALSFNAKKIQAIYEKCKELGWLDD